MVLNLSCSNHSIIKVFITHLVNILSFNFFHLFKSNLLKYKLFLHSCHLERQVSSIYFIAALYLKERNFTVCFADLDQGSGMIIFESILTTFEASFLLGQLQKMVRALKQTTISKFSLSKLVKHAVSFFTTQS
jgi:hypothetical protein